MTNLYEPYRAVMRARHGNCGPYRLGLAVGEDGADLPAPDYYTPTAQRTYFAGVKAGRRRALAKEPTP